jgi:demethylmenaquinone methyltransferase/2-methoxy-6-polyprenyl-1,4-benzoquinol methylase
MVDGLAISREANVLDIAAGTGLITRKLQSIGAEVISLDQSYRMLRPAVERGAVGVIATAEALPFSDVSFDAVTFGYLLRYVDDVTGCMTEIARVLRPGGRVGMVEFGRPRGLWRPLWWGYTRFVLPGAGLLAGRGWYRAFSVRVSTRSPTATHPIASSRHGNQPGSSTCTSSRCRWVVAW